MSISTYAELVTAVSDWTHRADLSGKIDDFITLTEKRIYNGSSYSEPLRVSSMMAQDTGSIASQVITLPTNYLETIRLSVTSGDSYPLEFVSPSLFSSYEDQAGDPIYYTVINGEIHTAPSTSLSYKHDYYKSFDALTSSATTNWLITNQPQVYLAGCLAEAFMYVQDERAAYWVEQFASAIKGLNESEKKRYQSNPMRVIAA